MGVGCGCATAERDFWGNLDFGILRITISPFLPPWGAYTPSLLRIVQLIFGNPAFTLPHPCSPLFPSCSPLPKLVPLFPLSSHNWEEWSIGNVSVIHQRELGADSCGSSPSLWELCAQDGQARDVRLRNHLEMGGTHLGHLICLLSWVGSLDGGPTGDLCCAPRSFWGGGGVSFNTYQ